MDNTAPLMIGHLFGGLKPYNGRPVRRFHQGGVRKNDDGVHSTPQERVARLGGWYGKGVSPLPLGGSGGRPPGKF